MPTKQYVNLPADLVDKTQGRKLELKATPDGGKAKGVKEVVWALSPGDKNCDKKYLAKADRGALKDEKSKEVAGEFKNELTLPPTGLDAFTVKVQKWGLFSNTTIKEMEFETWRRIYYSVHYIKDADLGIFQGLQARFEAAFAAGGIELKEIVSERKKTDVDTDYAEGGPDVAGYEMPYLFTAGAPALTKKPFHLRVLVVPDAGILEDSRVQQELAHTDTAAQDPGLWVEDLDAGTRPDPAGKEATVAELNAMELTDEQVTELKTPTAGNYYKMTAGGKLTKGNLTAQNNHLIAWDGAAWLRLKEGAKAKAADLDKLATPTKNELRVVEDAGTLKKGNVTTAANSEVYFDGTKWILVKNKGSFKAANLETPLAKPANGAVYKLKDGGRLKAGTPVDVLIGNLVKFDGTKWDVHHGKWVVHVKIAERLSQQDSWLGANHAKGTAVDSTTMKDVKDKIERVDAHKFDIKLHEEPLLNDCLDRGQKVSIDVKIKIVGGGLCGYNIYNVCVVRTNEKQPTRDNTILQTMTHEIGHGIRQTAKEFALYDSKGTATGKTEKNALFYTDDHGGQGPHCWTNAQEVDSTKTTSGKTYSHKAGKLCTMFHRDDAEVEPDGKFCPQCVTNIKATPYDSADLIGKGWNTYG